MKFKSLIPASAVLAFAALSVSGMVSASAEEAALPGYERSSGVAGNLSSVGSDTLANLMTLWAEEFNRHYPNVNIQVQAAGSSTAPPALAERTSNLGPMSRMMRENEVQAFESVFGYPPTPVPVAIDTLALFVHKDNPLEGMTLAQVDAVFSSNRRCGHNEDIRLWGMLGLEGPWARRDIQLFGRNSVSGTYGYFKDNALCDGDFKNNVNEQPGSASVVQSVSTSLNGIGYSGLGYRTSSVRTVPLARDSGSGFFAATPDNAVSGDYPLARFLYVYVNKTPNRPLPPLEREFLKLVLSGPGQEVVEKDGYIALPLTVVEQTRDSLGL